MDQQINWMAYCYYSSSIVELLPPLRSTTDGVTSNIQTQLDAKTNDGDNVNVLVGTTSAQTVPVDGNGDDNYLFLVVNKSNGALTCIDKTFLEAEG